MFNVVKICCALLACLTLCMDCAVSVSCGGCVDLDEISFNKTIKHFPYAIVKFDIAFPYDPKHIAFGDFASAVHRTTDELLVATVGIKDYGEMENKNLGLRFGFHEKNLPGILLFKAGNTEQLIPFPSYFDVTTEYLKQFINENTALYIGCEGCLKEFNVAVNNYAKREDQEQQQVIQQLLIMQEKLQGNEKNNAQTYVTFAQKIHSEGYGFVDAETQRLVRLRAGRVTKEKKEEMQRKLNILDQFRAANVEERVKKSEL